MKWLSENEQTLIKMVLEEKIIQYKEKTHLNSSKEIVELLENTKKNFEKVCEEQSNDENKHN